MSEHRYAMIMAGGSGTRLWPLSRKGLPKQLIPLFRTPGEDRARSLLELAADRLEGLIQDDRRYICAGERYREQIRIALPDFSDEQILGEPEGRDTVNAVGFAAAILNKLDKDAVFCVLTADHIIDPPEAFRRAIETGFRLVEQDWYRLVSFAIAPTYPATGFGYIEQGEPFNAFPDAFKVKRFVEKPDLKRATEYVSSGLFSWNSGMFVFHAGAFMKALKKFKPESYEGLTKIADAWATPDQQRVLDEVYPTLPKTSVDYAVMEPASADEDFSICGVSMPVRWLDVGSWPSYAETLPADDQGNRVSGNVTLTDSRGNLVVGPDDHTIALLGCDNLVVVHTPRATLVMPRERAQDLKLLHAELDEEVQ